ncbi:MAG: hypothetical protein K5838_04580 [Elusimicrobiales bacterium]|nr:hypothetical protein [Elusimicrobiales bacterium]
MKKKDKNKRINEEIQKNNIPNDEIAIPEEIKTLETPPTGISAKEPDISSKEVIFYFSTIGGLFLLAYILKYIFPNVPEYIFERLLLLVLAAFCCHTLWKISPEIRKFAYKIFPSMKRNQADSESIAIKKIEVINEENNAESVEKKI